MTEDEFRQSLQAQGYDETKLTEYQAGHVSEYHSHPFTARLLILEGEFVLRSPDGDRTFAAGDICDVPAGEVHAEHTEQVGARVLAGLKHPVEAS
jgi:quercetin dioxygenase-like cupin family protein